MYPGLWYLVASTIFLLIISAFISGAEAAYFSLRSSDINEIRDCRTRSCLAASNHVDHPELLLATLLISNNLVNVGIVISGSHLISELLIFNSTGAGVIAFKVIIISLVILVFGEILPKAYASEVPRRFSIFMALPLVLLVRLFNPLSRAMVKSTNFVNRRLSKNASKVSLNDISRAIDFASGADPGSKELLKGIVTFGGMKAGQIMTPKRNVVCVDWESDFQTVILVTVDTGYSRMPVRDQREGKIKGILYVKDLLPHLGKGSNFNWHELTREAFRVQEAKPINLLLQEFKTRKIHMAIVEDSLGEMTGIVTLEDILEEIVGDINDELDETETRVPGNSQKDISKMPDN